MLVVTSSLALVAIGVAIVGLVDRSDDHRTALEDGAVELPDGEDLGDAAPADSDGVGIGCEPDGCLVWRSGEIGHRPTTVVGELLIYDGRDEVVAIDVGRGEVQWRQDQPTPWPQASLASLRRVRTADDRLFLVAAGSHLWIRDAATGAMDRNLFLPEVTITRLRPSAGGFLVSGETVGEGPRSRTSLLALDLDGRDAWRRDVDRVVVSELADDGILVRDDGDLVAIESVDGSERWRREAAGWVAQVGSHLVHWNSGDDRIEVIAPADGQTLRDVTFDGTLRYVRAVGGSALFVAVGNEGHLLDMETSNRLDVQDAGRLGDDDPVAVETPDGLAVLWPRRGEQTEPELAIYPVDGVDDPRRIPLPRHPDLETRAASNAMEVLDTGTIRVVLAGQQLFDVDMANDRILRVLSASQGWSGPVGQVAPVIGNSIEITLAGTVALVRSDAEVRLVGSNGEVRLLGVSRLVSADPPIVQGAGGVLRVRHDLLVPP